MIFARKELSTSFSSSGSTSFSTRLVFSGAGKEKGGELSIFPLGVNKELSSEVTSGRREVFDSAVRVDPSVEGAVVRRMVVASGRELGVVHGHVVVIVVRAVVVLV